MEPNDSAFGKLHVFLRSARHKGAAGSGEHDR
jgi:hypothetical protein